MIRRILLALTFILGGIAPAFADDAADATKAQALVEKAVAYYKQVGREKAIADFSDKTNKDWVDGEWYVIVADADTGIFRAHLTKALTNDPKIWDLKDVNNRYIIRDMVEAGKNNPNGGWTEYVWTNPATKKAQPKKTFVRKVDDSLFMVGYYVN